MAAPKSLIFNILNLKKLILFSLASVILVSCSSEKEGWFPRNWHNVLAKYNGYFLAREKMKETEDGMLKSHVENFNRILEVYTQPKTGSAQTHAAAMDEVIKKASIPIQRHKNSDWVDDSYLLIGKARFYKEDWDNALATFKYVNSNSKDKNTRHQAVIWLLRTYVRTEDYGFAQDVISFLKKQNMSKHNLRDASLAAAYYEYRLKNYKRMREYLNVAVPLMKKGDAKARLLYALGQLNQRFKDDPVAYEQYKAVLKNNPAYELGFYAKLNLAQVTALDNPEQIKKTQKIFTKLLKDPKNEEYKDKILYEMGMFELKQNHVPLAVENLKKSLKAKGTNPNQKSYSYLRLGEIHYERLKKYVVAKAYYDSCVATLDTADENYKSIVRRQKILTEFVEQYQIIEKEDSLQKLAKMDTTQIFAIIDKMILAKQEQAKKAEKEAKKAERLAMLNGDAGGGGNSALDAMGSNQPAAGASIATGGTWYFYDLMRVQSGKSEFIRKWGNRKLGDNWRRSQKESGGEEEETTPGDTASAKAGETAKSTGNEADKPEAEGDKGQKSGKGKKEDNLKTLREPYLAEIPFSPDQLKASHEKLKPALFKIGKIYDQKLEERENAVQSFERLYKDYGDYEKTPEGVYNLCIIFRKNNDTPNYEKWKAVLLKDYPNTVFAKLIVNPNYLIENKARNQQISGLYKRCYEQYKGNLFIEAAQGIASIRNQFPQSDYEEKLELLSLLITGKTLDIRTYKSSIEAYIAKFPKSTLKPFAETLLKNCESFMAGKAGSILPPSTDSTLSGGKTTAPEFSLNLDQPQLFMAIIPINSISEEELKTKFSDFNQKFYGTETFSVTTLLLGDNKHIILKVQMLPSKIQALNYMNKQKSESAALKGKPNVKPKYFVITQENFIKFYQSKDIKAYENFFEKNYVMEEFEEIPSFGK